MQRLKVIKDFSTPEGVDPVNNFVDQMLRDLPEDLRIAMAAGCRVEATVSNGEKGGDTKIIIRTRFPVSILKYPDGRVLDVYEKRS